MIYIIYHNTYVPFDIFMPIILIQKFVLTRGKEQF